MDKRLNDIIRLNTYNKKVIDSKFTYLLENLCFYYLKPLSDYMYSVGADIVKYNAFCESVFKEVGNSLSNARKSNNVEEFEDSILHCVNYAEGIALKAHDKLDFLGDTPEDPDIYFDLVENIPIIYEKFYKRARKYKPRKRS